MRLKRKCSVLHLTIHVGDLNSIPYIACEVLFFLLRFVLCMHVIFVLIFFSIGFLILILYNIYIKIKFDLFC